MLLKRYISLFLTVLPLYIVGQVQEVDPPEYIKTITFKSNTPESQLPVLRLGEPLILEFDDINGDEEDYYYVIEHFDFDWTPSILSKAEYLRGMDNQRIIEYHNSFNTYQLYSHYKLSIPNQQTRALLKTGNYMISIYDDYGDLMFSRKFMIYEQLVNVGAIVKRTRDMSTIQEKQTLNMTISSNSINFNNPLETVKTLIVQNNNLRNSISDLKPQYVLGNELTYRYNQESSFWGGNEFLNFENKDVRASNVGVQFTDLEDIYQSYLFTNISRANQTYTYYPDINGNFLITVIDREDPSVEADYTNVHFSLIYEELKDKDIYVYGGFNNYAIEPQTKMTYNKEKGVYECAFLLKQGFYNYKYVIVDKKGNIDENTISGSFWQTENNYKVLVYYRDLGARYDRLIGFGETSSVNISN